MTTVYNDLFEDEVADVLRSAGPDAVIERGPLQWHAARAIDEDGIISPGNGMYIEYYNGRRSAYLNTAYLIARLTHTEFTVKGE